MTGKMTEIELKAKDYSDAYDVLVERVTRLNDEVESVKRRYLLGLKNAVRAAAEKKSDLTAAIDANRDLFEKPRTQVFHGIKVGLRKLNGALEFSSAADVIKAIKKYFDDMKDALISTTEKVNVKAIEGMPEADLKKIGCKVKPGTDEIVISPTDSNVDKIVEALLKDAEGLEEEERLAA